MFLLLYYDSVSFLMFGCFVFAFILPDLWRIKLFKRFPGQGRRQLRGDVINHVSPHRPSWLDLANKLGWTQERQGRVRRRWRCIRKQWSVCQTARSSGRLCALGWRLWFHRATNTVRSNIERRQAVLAAARVAVTWNGPARTCEHSACGPGHCQNQWRL